VDFADRQEEGTLSEIRIGGAPPDFRLPAPGNTDFGLSDFRGKRHVVLAFYPFDWSPG
jgi:peroxiredoxin Q/BCP